MVDEYFPIEGEITEPGSPVIPGWNDAPVRGGRVDVAASSVVAGDPDGARVEVAADGLHAYDSTGTETAAIRGEGGEFVGGAYRTTAGTAGRVTMSDSAAGGNPGIEVQPMVTTGYTRFPSIMPSTDGMSIAGGVGTDGSQAGAVAKHSYSSLYHNGPGSTGSGSWAEVTPTEVKLTYRGDRSQPAAQSRLQAQSGQAQMIAQLSSTAYSAITTTQNGSELYTTDGAGTVARSTADTSVSRLFFQTPTVSGQVRVDQTETYVTRTSGGVTRYLTVDDAGIWVKTNSGGSWRYYNLEKTASDSGWVPLTAASGFTAVSEGFDVRQLGRMIYFRGAVTGNVTTDWVTIGTIPTGYRPVVRQINAGASSSVTNLMFQTLQSGALQVKGNTAATGISIFVNTIFYPAD